MGHRIRSNATGTTPYFRMSPEILYQTKTAVLHAWLHHLLDKQVNPQFLRFLSRNDTIDLLTCYDRMDCLKKLTKIRKDQFELYQGSTSSLRRLLLRDKTAFLNYRNRIQTMCRKDLLVLLPVDPKFRTATLEDMIRNKRLHAPDAPDPTLVKGYYLFQKRKRGMKEEAPSPAAW